VSLEEFEGNRKTKVTAFSLPPNIMEKLELYAKSGKYGGKSAIATQALSEFFAREGNPLKKVGDLCEESKNLETTLPEIITEYLKSPEGKALIKSIIRESLTPSSKNDKPIVIEHIIE